VNVGGFRHEVRLETLQKFPQTRLGQLATNKEPLGVHDGYNKKKNEFYFDRNPNIFNIILDFYRTGKLHFNDKICVTSFKEELDFWIISESNMSACCKDNYLTKKLKKEKQMKDDKKVLATDSQSCMWNILDNPSSSVPACLYYLLSLFFVLLYLVAFTLNTVPSFLLVDINGELLANTKLTIIQLVCLGFCTLEFILRFVSSPRKCQFLKCGMNILDLLVLLVLFIAEVIPVFFIAEVVPASVADMDESESSYVETTTAYDTYSEEESYENNSSIIKILKIFRVLRVIWIFKLVRYSTDLQTVTSILWNSLRELFLLLQVLLVMVFLFGTLVYYCEMDQEDTMFTSLPDAFWFAIVSITTVGYGDMTPVTGFGKLFGSLCVVFGITSMVLPIIVIAINFAEFYENRKTQQEISKYE